MTRPIDFEQYAAENGIAGSFYSDPAMHRSSEHISHGQRKRQLKQYQVKLIDHEEKRNSLRSEYNEAVANNEIRPLTRIEKLELTANGHPDNPATQAAIRLLLKLKD